MDFKVAGTERGITALQMDIKITGVTFDILRDALAQAKEARTFILAKMADVIKTPREQLSQYAPRIQTIQIDPSQIGLLDRQGRGNDSRSLGGVRIADRRQRRGPGADLLRQRRARRRSCWSASG